METVKSTAVEMSDSLVTSHGTKVAFGPSSRAVSWPASCWISASTTLAPWEMNLVAVSFPIPLAAPVIRATLPSSLLQHHKSIFGISNIEKSLASNTSMHQWYRATHVHF